MKKLILALVLVVGACKGSPFDPYSNPYKNECHPDRWYSVPQDTTPELKAAQIFCRDQREAGNGR